MNDAAKTLTVWRSGGGGAQNLPVTHSVKPFLQLKINLEPLKTSEAGF